MKLRVSKLIKHLKKNYYTTLTKKDTTIQNNVGHHFPQIKEPLVLGNIDSLVRIHVWNSTSILNCTLVALYVTSSTVNWLKATKEFKGSDDTHNMIHLLQETTQWKKHSQSFDTSCCQYVDMQIYTHTQKKKKNQFRI